jgi:ATP-dependent DNA helicase PIF1
MTQSEALQILKTGANVFLTGEPGAGKTYTLNEYVSYLRAHEVEVAITASTGIAATHIGGMTIHSWSGIGIKKTLDKYELDKIASSEYVSKRVRRAKVLVIDEVSMLSPETLSMVDAVYREVLGKSDAFGGLQVVLVGDFFQLPPIVRAEDEKIKMRLPIEEKQKIFAYESGVWQRAGFLTCYITEQHRQEDETFLDVLTAIRRDIFDTAHIEHLEKRIISRDMVPAGIPKLYSHNRNVDEVNDFELKKVDGEVKTFYMESSGAPALIESLKRGCLSPEILTLKIGAKVMCTKNKGSDGYVNGTLGEVVAFDKDSGYPVIKTKSNQNILIEPDEWSVDENGRVKARISQVPLRLAWAITVHKSQGMSLDEAVVDLSSVFEYGQGYVALSRVRTLAGLHILGYNEMTFKVHPEVLEQDKAFRENSENARVAFSKLSASDLKKMEENFILASGGTIIPVSGGHLGARHPSRKKGKPDTYSETLKFWNEGKNIKEIAKERELAPQTIFSHIEELVESGKIGKGDLSRLMTPSIKKGFTEIKKGFLEIGVEKLTPVKAHLKDKYSFDEIRVVRMMM